jgi:hypothetical protein
MEGLMGERHGGQPWRARMGAPWEIDRERPGRVRGARWGASREGGQEVDMDGQDGVGLGTGEMDANHILLSFEPNKKWLVPHTEPNNKNVYP